MIGKLMWWTRGIWYPYVENLLAEAYKHDAISKDQFILLRFMFNPRIITCSCCYPSWINSPELKKARGEA